MNKPSQILIQTGNDLWRQETVEKTETVFSAKCDDYITVVTETREGACKRGP